MPTPAVLIALLQSSKGVHADTRFPATACRVHPIAVEVRQHGLLSVSFGSRSLTALCTFVVLVSEKDVCFVGQDIPQPEHEYQTLRGQQMELTHIKVACPSE